MVASTQVPSPFVLGDTPRNGQEVVLFSTKRRGIDVLIPKAEVTAKWALGGYTKYTIDGRTDKGGSCRVVARTSESNEDELQVLEVTFR